MKICAKCERLKSKSEFNKSASSTAKDKLTTRCKHCIKNDKQTARIRRQVEEGSFFAKNFLSMFTFGGELFKCCSKCKEYAPVSNFSKDKTKRTGYGSTCLSCERLRYKSKNALLREYRNEYERQRKLTDPSFKLKKTISDQVRKAVKGKGGLSTFDFLPYTVDELKRHIESKFQDGMSWNNHGDWHIDHIKPQALFNIQSMGDKDFLECWSLSNLQPLWAKDNLSKGKKY